MKKAVIITLVMMVVTVLTAEVVDIYGHTYLMSIGDEQTTYTYLGDQLQDAFLDIKENFNCEIDWLDCTYLSDDFIEDNASESSTNPANIMAWSGIQRETGHKVDVILCVNREGELILSVATK